MEKSAVLIDIAGKQNYIFSSNKLKDIVGASEIIRQVTHKNMIEGFCQNQLNLSEVEGNYGGGNALVFFDDEDKAKDFINKYSKYLLINYPSLVVYFGLNTKFDDSDFKECNKKTHKDLDELKNSFYPLSQPLSLGFEEFCANSDFPASKSIYTPENTKTHISKATSVKREKSKDANEKFNNDYKDVLGSDYTFSLELEKIIHDQKSFIAVSHIDVNDLGSRVKKLEKVEDFQEFSKFIDKSMKDALSNTIKELIKNLGNFSFVDISKLNLYDENDKLVLPFRPIILSGDDFTFVSEGRLGVLIAKTFINELAKIHFEKGDKEPLYASGGVAIVKAKTPFFRAYEIAENLTESAKKLTRKDKKIKTSIDFVITSSSILGDLDFLRQNLYTHKNEKLFSGGYDEVSFNKLLDLMRDLSKISKTKIMKIRELIFENNESLKKYLETYCEKKLLENGEIKDKNMLLEAIELLNFYPKSGEKYE